MGLVLVIASALLPEFLRRAVNTTAQGLAADPLPPTDPPPPKTNFTFPAPTPTPMDTLSVVIARRWARKYGQRLSPEQVAMVAAQAALVTNYGAGILTFNPVGRRADRFWAGAWTVRREPAWRNGRPLYRWAPIRAYPSLDMGVFNWITGLPPAAVAAVHANDLTAFAAALLAGGWASTLASEYEAELSVTTQRILTGDFPKPAPAAAPA